jgi:hypothetical protein
MKAPAISVSGYANNVLCIYSIAFLRYTLLCKSSRKGVANVTNHLCSPRFELKKKIKIRTDA